MGCCESKPSGGTAANDATATTTATDTGGGVSGGAGDGGTGTKAGQSGPKGKRPRTDFVVKGETGGVVTRSPGFLNGTAFKIANCEDTSIYVCDWLTQVTVDNCNRCKIFLGPCEGSVMIRDCTNCVFVVACQQFRTRDLVDCDIFLFSLTAPVIESSKQLRFGCFQAWYEELAAQFVAAGLPVFSNRWSSIYDFTPPADTVDAGTLNWAFVAEELSAADLMKCPPIEMFAGDDADADADAGNNDNNDGGAGVGGTQGATATDTAQDMSAGAEEKGKTNEAGGDDGGEVSSSVGESLSAGDIILVDSGSVSALSDEPADAGKPHQPFRLDSGAVVPKTWGNRPTNSDEDVLVVLYGPDSRSMAYTLIAQLAKQDETFVVVRAREREAAEVARILGDERTLGSGDKAVGLHFNGDGVSDAARQLAVGEHVTAPGADVDSELDAFFQGEADEYTGTAVH